MQASIYRPFRAANAKQGSSNIFYLRVSAPTLQHALSKHGLTALGSRCKINWQCNALSYLCCKRLNVPFMYTCHDKYLALHIADLSEPSRSLLGRPAYFMPDCNSNDCSHRGSRTTKLAISGPGQQWQFFFFSLRKNSRNCFFVTTVIITFIRKRHL